MNEYLANLVDRALGLAPHVEPVIASMHDSAGVSSGFAEAAEEEVIPKSLPARVISPESAPPPVLERPDDDLHLLVPNADALAQTARVEGAVPEPAGPDTRTAQPPLKPVSSSTTDPDRETHLPLQPQPTFPKQDGGTPTAKTQRASAPRSERAFEGPLVIQPEIVKRSERAPEVPLRPPPPDRSHSAPPPIRVTIGRIDVRAVLSHPPAPRKPAPAMPALSLRTTSNPAAEVTDEQPVRPRSRNR
jgi:hypothetical protein